MSLKVRILGHQLVIIIMGIIGIDDLGLSLDFTEDDNAGHGHGLSPHNVHSELVGPIK